MDLFLYILLTSILLVGIFFFNKKINLNYKNFGINNFKLYLECILINLSSLCFGKNYFSFSVYLVAIIMIYLVYLTKGYNEIKEENIRVAKSAKYFATHFIFILLLNFPICFISGLKIIGFTFLSALALLVIFALETLVCVKREEGYKLKTPEEISKLFPNYDINNLYKMCFDTFITIEKNLTTHTIDNIKTYLEEAMYNSYKEEETSYLNKNEKHVLIDPTYVSGGLIDYKVDGTIQVFEIELVFNAIEYTVNLETGTITSGSTTRVKKCTFVLTYNYENNVLKLANKKKYKEE